MSRLGYAIKIHQWYGRVSHLFKRKSKVMDDPSPPDNIPVTSDSVNPVDNDVHVQSPSHSLHSTASQGSEDDVNKLSSCMARKNAEPFMSQKLCDLIGYGVNLGFFAGVHYYYWEGKKNRTVLKNPGFNMRWWFATWMLVQYFIFLTVQLILQLTSNSGLDFDKLMLFYAMALMLMPLVCQMGSKIYQEELVGFVNRALQFAEDFAQLFDTDLRERETSELKIAKIFLQSAYSSLGLVIFLVLCTSIAMPDLSVFLSSLHPKPIFSYQIPMRTISVIILHAIQWAYVAACTVYASALAIVIHISLTISYLHILHENQTRYGPHELLHHYRQLYLLFEELNQFSSLLLLPPLENIFITLTIFGLYGTLRTDGVLRFALLAIGCVVFTCLILMIWTLSKVHSASTQVLASWKRDARFSKRELRSMKAIQIRLASYAYVDAGIIITIVEIIINYSITLLITT